jgi:hypothetical protein
MVVPFPSSPKALSPQQYATPFGVSAQVEYFSPALIAANESPPDAATGVELFVVVPLPNSPDELSPQQYAAPLGVTPQL